MNRIRDSPKAGTGIGLKKQNNKKKVTHGGNAVHMACFF